MPETAPTQTEDEKVYADGVDSVQIYIDDIEGRLAEARTDEEKRQVEIAREHLDHALGRASIGGAEGSGIRLIHDGEYERARRASHRANIQAEFERPAN